MTVYAAKNFKVSAFAFFCDSFETDESGNIVKVNVHPKPGYFVEHKDNKPIILQKNEYPFKRS